MKVGDPFRRNVSVHHCATNLGLAVVRGTNPRGLSTASEALVGAGGTGGDFSGSLDALGPPGRRVGEVKSGLVF